MAAFKIWGLFATGETRTPKRRHLGAGTRACRRPAAPVAAGRRQRVPRPGPASGLLPRLARSCPVATRETQNSRRAFRSCPLLWPAFGRQPGGNAQPRLQRPGPHMTMPAPEGGGVIGIAARRGVHDAACLACVLGICLLVGFLNFSLNAAAAVYRIAVITGPLPDLRRVLIPAGCNLGAGCAAA